MSMKANMLVGSENDMLIGGGASKPVTDNQYDKNIYDFSSSSDKSWFEKAADIANGLDIKQKGMIAGVIVLFFIVIIIIAASGGH